jgi:hypothetical protein
MKIGRLAINNANVNVTRDELISLIKVIEYTLLELEGEYSTRTGFYEIEAQALIEKLQMALQDRDSVITVHLTDLELMILLANLLEVTAGIRIDDHFSSFGMSETELDICFTAIDQYGKDHGLWKDNPGGPNPYAQTT